MKSAYSIIAGLTLVSTAACAQSDPRVSDLVRAGEVRVGLFSTQYKANGEPKGARPDIVRELVARIGTKMTYVLRSGPLDIIDCVRQNECDAVILHRDERGIEIADFSFPILQYEFTMLVLGHSALQNVSETDDSYVHIAAVRGHAAANVLTSKMKRAKVVLVESEDAALASLRDGHVTAIAQTRHSLLRMSASLPGSRVLAGNYGMNINRIAIPKGHPGRLSYINDFVEQAKSSGLFQEIIDRDKGSVFQVAPQGER